jgi:hypothetical protein
MKESKNVIWRAVEVIQTYYLARKSMFAKAIREQRCEKQLGPEGFYKESAVETRGG